jgi:hypothetical protein
MAVACCAAIAVAAPALASADVYSNAGYALLGLTAYHPPPSPFPNGFDVINDWWGTPMVPSPYGPLWIGVARIETFFGGATLLGKLIALRAFGMLAFAATLYALRRLRLPVAVLAIAACNPMLWMQVVSNAHNDGFAMMLIAASALAVTASPIVCAAFVVAAGLVKLPYLFLGLALFARIVDTRKRLLLAAATAVAGLAASWAFGGAAYLNALGVHLGSRSPFLSPLHALVALVAVAALLLAVVRRTWIRGAEFTMPALAAGLFPWYLLWGFPYVLTRPNALAGYLILLPIAAAAVDTVFYRPWLEALFVLAGVVFAFLSLRRARPA